MTELGQHLSALVAEWAEGDPAWTPEQAATGLALVAWADSRTAAYGPGAAGSRERLSAQVELTIEALDQERARLGPDAAELVAWLRSIQTEIVGVMIPPDPAWLSDSLSALAMRVLELGAGAGDAILSLGETAVEEAQRRADEGELITAGEKLALVGLAGLGVAVAAGGGPAGVAARFGRWLKGLWR